MDAERAPWRGGDGVGTARAGRRRRRHGRRHRRAEQNRQRRTLQQLLLQQTFTAQIHDVIATRTTGHVAFHAAADIRTFTDQQPATDDLVWTMYAVDGGREDGFCIDFDVRRHSNVVVATVDIVIYRTKCHTISFFIAQYRSYHLAENTSICIVHLTLLLCVINTRKTQFDLMRELSRGRIKINERSHRIMWKESEETLPTAPLENFVSACALVILYTHVNNSVMSHMHE